MLRGFGLFQFFTILDTVVIFTFGYAVFVSVTRFLSALCLSIVLDAIRLDTNHKKRVVGPNAPSHPSRSHQTRSTRLWKLEAADSGSRGVFRTRLRKLEAG